MNDEVWALNNEYDKPFYVSNKGRIKKEVFGKERISVGFDNWCGYKMVSLKKDGKKKDVRIHRLVAMAFIEQPIGKNVINHKDLNKSNNCVENLEWCTQLENIKHAKDNDARNIKHRDLEIFKDIKDDVPTRQISEKHGVSMDIVRRVAKENNYKITSKKYKINRKEMILEFKKNTSNKDIAIKFNTNSSLIARYRYLWKKELLLIQ